MSPRRTTPASDTILQSGWWGPMKRFEIGCLHYRVPIADFYSSAETRAVRAILARVINRDRSESERFGLSAFSFRCTRPSLHAQWTRNGPAVFIADVFALFIPVRVNENECDRRCTSFARDQQTGRCSALPATNGKVGWRNAIGQMLVRLLEVPHSVASPFSSALLGVSGTGPVISVSHRGSVPCAAYSSSS
jgi:hypothetical protein